MVQAIPACRSTWTTALGLQRPRWWTAAWQRRTRWLLASTLVVGEIVWVFDQDAYPGNAWWLVVGVLLVLHTLVVHLEARTPVLPVRSVLAGAVLTAGAAVLAAPNGSRDVYQYAMYGRMVTEYHANPYLQVPAAFPHDPLYLSLSPAWHHTSTVYGPLFTGLSAVGAVFYGSSAVLAAHFFQLVAALALLGAVVYLMRRRAGSAALVFVGLSPVLLATVNGAHNDLLAGVLVLVGLDQARRDRLGRSAVVLAAACLVKALAAPAVLGVMVVLVVARRWRAAVTFAVRLGAIIAAGYVAFGGIVALVPLRGLDEVSSRASAWVWLRSFHLTGRSHHGGFPTTMVPLVLFAVLAAIVVFAHVRRGDFDVAELSVTLLACSVFAASYVLPWYPAALLPAAALVLRAPARRLAQLGAAALLVAYVSPPGVHALRGDPVILVGRVCGVVLGAVVVALVLATVRRHRAPAL